MRTKDPKRAAVEIFLRTCAAIDVETLFNQKLSLQGEELILGDSQRIALGAFDRIFAIGVGKASLKMGRALERLLGSRITKGILVTDRRHKLDVRSEVLVGSHPTPDETSLIAGRKVMDLVASADEHTLVIFLISGGGSSLIEVPLVPEVTAEDIACLNRILITSSATIHEINVVRKHLSLVKGGRLGALAAGAGCLAIYVSDVNSGDLQSVASNPVLSDAAELSEFFDVVARYELVRKLPKKFARAIESGKIPELPRAGYDALTFLLSDNSTAMSAAANAAADMGFRTEVFADLVEGDYKEIADKMLDRLIHLRGEDETRPLCVISGGEVICPVHGGGRGGRNQEFVLYSAAQLRKHGGSTAVLSCGTDGIDGNSVAAGAVADSRTIEEARSFGLDYLEFLENNDSFSFFRRAGGLVVTGPTGNNVRDVRLMLCNADGLA
jgi:glycerate 2-kinase